MRQIDKRAWLFVVLSAGLQILIFPLPNLYGICWVSITPLLFALLQARHSDRLQLRTGRNLLPAKPIEAFLLAYVCGVLWYGGTCYWIYPTMRHYGGLSAVAAATALILFCLYLAIYHGVFGLLISLLAKGEPASRRALVVSPFAWVAVELARTRITGFPWNLLGTCQVDNIPLARNQGSWLLVGAIGVEHGRENPGRSTEIYNSAQLVSPTGEWDGRYDKVHLVPFGEYVPFARLFSFAGGLTKEVGDFSPGTSRTPLVADGVKLGVFICYESIFPDEVRRFAAQGAQVLVNLSNDGWYGDSGAFAQHLKQARARAIENDRWLLRATNTGVTASIDPYGRVVASLPRKERSALSAPYALESRTTFYTRHGDWFAYICAIIWGAAWVLPVAFPKRVES